MVDEANEDDIVQEIKPVAVDEWADEAGADEKMKAAHAKAVSLVDEANEDDVEQEIKPVAVDEWADEAGADEKIKAAHKAAHKGCCHCR